MADGDASPKRKSAAGRSFPRPVTKVLGAMQRIDPSSGKRYTDYGFEVYLLGSNWQIYKRYSQFDELRKYLLKKYSAVVDRVAWPAFPEKVYVGSNDTDVVQARAAKLQVWFTGLLSKRLVPVCADRVLLDFLGAPQSAMTTRGIEAALRRYTTQVVAWASANPAVGGGEAAAELAAFGWSEELEHLSNLELLYAFQDAKLQVPPSPLPCLLDTAA